MHIEVVRSHPVLAARQSNPLVCSLCEHQQGIKVLHKVLCFEGLKGMGSHERLTVDGIRKVCHPIHILQGRKGFEGPGSGIEQSADGLQIHINVNLVSALFVASCVCFPQASKP